MIAAYRARTPEAVAAAFRRLHGPQALVLLARAAAIYPADEVYARAARLETARWRR